MNCPDPPVPVASELIDLLQCPVSGEPLHWQGGMLVSASGRNEYRVTDSAIPVMAAGQWSHEGVTQSQHYDRVAAAYLRNLTYAHTQEYMRYLDNALLQATDGAVFDTVAEVCCGRGEALQLFRTRIGRGVGLDVSLRMLEAGRSVFPHDQFLFVQGDATGMPLRSECFDCVFTLGGIHHVNDRPSLFREVFRILKPGGRFYWREPVSDLFLWRWLRHLIYRISPGLEHDTERPLRWHDTWPLMQSVGFEPVLWRTYGFLGYCFLMNSDILVFNRAFHFVPGIRAITRCATYLDDLTVRLPGLRLAGLQVVGYARKPGGQS